METKNIDELKEEYRKSPADQFEYYCEEEVIYVNTHLNSNGNYEKICSNLDKNV